MHRIGASFKSLLSDYLTVIYHNALAAIAKIERNQDIGSLSRDLIFAVPTFWSLETRELLANVS